MSAVPIQRSDAARDRPSRSTYGGPRKPRHHPNRQRSNASGSENGGARSVRPDRGRGNPGRGRSGRPDREGALGQQPDPASAFADDIVEAPTGQLPSFAELGLPQPILRVLTATGITAPFPIQAATLPDCLAGCDVLGRGQTGSGKTLAFGLAMLTRLSRGERAKPRLPRALVLVPTRELAVQVTTALAPFARALGLHVGTVVGGTSFVRQTDELRRGIDLLVATPGRLSDHVRQGTCSLDDVALVTLDEADQMADMGFLPQVRAILDLTQPGGQRMLFSATLDRGVDAVVRQYLHDPVTHSVTPVSASITTMDHHVLLMSDADKQSVVNAVAARDGRTIMFVRTKHSVDRLAKKLRTAGVRAGALHGGKTQGVRSRTLDDFRGGRTPVLVATDVAARGIHVDNVSLVVHVDPPADHKDYLHRAGRTARAGESGTVVILATPGQRKSVQDLTSAAGVVPTSTAVRPGDEQLARITGAREPSGTPISEAVRTSQPRRPARATRAGRRPVSAAVTAGRTRPRGSDAPSRRRGPG